jgi:hypothetical protein
MPGLRPLVFASERFVLRCRGDAPGKIACSIMMRGSALKSFIVADWITKMPGLRPLVIASKRFVLRCRGDAPGKIAECSTKMSGRCPWQNSMLYNDEGRNPEIIYCSWLNYRDARPTALYNRFRKICTKMSGRCPWQYFGVLHRAIS